MCINLSKISIEDAELFSHQLLSHYNVYQKFFPTSLFQNLSEDTDVSVADFVSYCKLFCPVIIIQSYNRDEIHLTFVTELSIGSFLNFLDCVLFKLREGGIEHERSQKTQTVQKS